jgi:hypothetical protein
MSDMRDAIEETRAVSEMQEQDRFDRLNPFFEGQRYSLIVEVTDRKELWDFVGKNLYAGKNEIPGSKLVAVKVFEDTQFQEVLNDMESFLRKHGRIP